MREISYVQTSFFFKIADELAKDGVKEEDVINIETVRAIDLDHRQEVNILPVYQAWYWVEE